MNELTKYLVEELIGENKSISKIVVVYSGRFQPFHTGHYDSYQYLVNKFGKDNVFIGTSNKTDNDKSPLNFNEKLKVMQTMFGISPSKVVMLKNPYRPIELLSKYDSEKTALISVVGEKDSDRLGGRYFEKWNDNLLKNGELRGYLEKGYVFVTPSHAKGISGTQVRNGLSMGDEGDKMDFFKKVYGKFDRNIFNLITKKLNTENIIIPKKIITDWLLKEYSTNTVDADDGPNMFTDFANHKIISIKRAKQIGFEVVGKILSDVDSDITDYRIYPDGPPPAVSFYPAGVIGKLTAKNTIDIYSDEAYDVWYKHMVGVAINAGYQLVNLATAKMDLDNIKRISTSGLDSLLKVNETVYFPFEAGSKSIINGKRTEIKNISFINNRIPVVNGKVVESIKYKNGNFLVKLYEGLLNEIPMPDLKQIDKFADKKLNPLNIVLTHTHFFDRLQDPRNIKPISSAELIGFITRLSRKRDKFIEFLNKYKEIVAVDDRTKLNIPFMKKANSVIAKTIMRKDDFKTSSPILKTERIIKETSSNSFSDDGEPETGYLTDGSVRVLDVGKPENWFKQGAYTQIDFPKSDYMRGIGVDRDVDSLFRKVVYKLKNFDEGDLKPAENPEGVDQWEVIDTETDDKIEKETRYWELSELKKTNLNMREDKIKGGLSNGMTLIDIAKKHAGVDNDYKNLLTDLKRELIMGIKVEKEHTDNQNIAREIALDHLFEDPKYYTKLKKIEKPISEAGQGGVTAASLKKYYTAICKSEGVEPLPLKFERVKFGGAATTYNIITMKPLYISFDLNRMYDPEYAVLHELTHQIKLLTEKDAYAGKRDQLAKFKKLENRLIDKYMYSKYSSLLYPKSK